MKDPALFRQVTKLQREAIKLQALFISPNLTVEQCYTVTKRVNKLIALSEGLNQRCGVVENVVEEGEHDSNGPNEVRVKSKKKNKGTEGNGSKRDNLSRKTVKRLKAKKKKKILPEEPAQIVEKKMIEVIYIEDQWEVSVIKHKVTAPEIVVIDDDHPPACIDLTVDNHPLPFKKITKKPASKHSADTKDKPAVSVTKSLKSSSSKKPSDVVLCKSCLLPFDSKATLKLHKPVCKNIACGKDFNVFDLFEPESNHCCPVCQKHFSSSKKVRAHLNSFHGIRVYLAVCHKCNKGFKGFPRLRTHLTRNPNCYVQCKICHKKYHDRVYNLREHIKGTHIDKSAICCPLCPKRFATKLGREAHIAVTHFEARPHTCAKCKKGFAHWRHLQLHQSKTRCSGRVFKCNLCEQLFSVINSLRTHLIAKHNVTASTRVRAKDFEVKAT